MIRIIEGDSDGSSLKIGVAVASWNRTVTDRLLQASLDELESAGVTDIVVLRVPGALELPVAVGGLIDAGCDGVIAIGTIVKGDTDHYEIVTRESSAGIARVAERRGVPVANAILAVHDIADAIDRSQPGKSNKGVEAALAAVTMANALRSVRGESRSGL